MRINGYRCDGCGKEHLLAPYYNPQMHGDGLPNDWFMLIKPRLDAIEQPRFFCDFPCLHKWLQKLLAEQVHMPEAEDKKIKSSQRRLTLILRCDLLAGMDQGYFHARGRTVYELFAQKFPEAEELDEKIHNIEEVKVIDWRYTLADAYEEHIEWAKLAKECSLIDLYIVEPVDEVPA